MFSWMSKDEERKKNADVYSSVTAGLQNVYRTKLLPLEKVIWCYFRMWVPLSPMLLVELKTSIIINLLHNCKCFRNITFMTFTRQLLMIQILMPGLWLCWWANIPPGKRHLLDTFLNKIFQALE